MLDIKLIRKDPDFVKAQIARRNTALVAEIEKLIDLDQEHRKELQIKQELEAQKNKLSKEVGTKKGKGENADAEIQELNLIKEKLKAIADLEPELFAKQKAILEAIPNLPAEDIPDGADEEANQEISRYLEPKTFSFETKDHDEIGRELGIFDFERGVKLAKSRFTLLRAYGAKLERALINFMLDKASQKDFVEIFPPILANAESLYGTGQLPKFEEDLFKIENTNLYLIPTSEVPLTNIYRDEILADEDLPMHFCAYTPNFRSEAGAASKDTRGIIRQHQFNKIELVTLCRPEESKELHERLTEHAESILQALGLPYRKMLLCTGDMGFSAHRCYDLEVWFAGQGKYREISSCSNFADFQARRAQIRFRRDSKSKTELIHTINGSGLAVGRTMAAILEYYQNEDGTVTVPEVLRAYGLPEIIS